MNFVGEYQVCQKWLKDRKGRQLSNKDEKLFFRILGLICCNWKFIVDILVDWR
jgi:hypothetical protein